MSADASGQETAFGNDSSWWGSLPALLAGGLTLILAGFGTWILPRGLPDQYQSALTEAELAYSKIETGAASAGVEELSRLAGEIAVIHKRLISLDRGEPARYWQLAKFQRQHADLLKEKIDDAAASFLEDERTELVRQMGLYEQQGHETLILLASGDSEFRFPATVQLSKDAYREGVQNYGVADAEKLAEELSAQLAEQESSSTLSEDDLADARLLLAQLWFESAWQTSPTETLVLDESRVEEAWECAKSFALDEDLDDKADGLKWSAVQLRLDAFRPQQTATELQPSKSPGVIQVADSDRVGDWQTKLAELQTLAIRGAWNDIGFILASDEGSQALIVRSGIGRTICRLACSSKARNEPEFANGFDAGLELAYRTASHLPEFADLIWYSAIQHRRRTASETNNSSDIETAKVAPSVVSAILGGRSAVLKHTVLAVSMSLQERPMVARNHLQLVLRSGGDFSVVSRAILRQFQPGKQVEPADLEAQRELLEMAVSLEPAGGLSWFALANVQFRLERLDDAVASLEKALELLGDVPAIQEMMSTIEAQSK